MDAIKRRYRASTEAADWWAILHADEVSRAHREQFIEWLRESHIHVTEILRVVQVHGALQEFEEWDTLPKDGAGEDATVVPISQAISVKRSRWGLWLSSIAAGVLVLIVSGLLLLPPLLGQVISTERGERREVVLNDGSVVKVDPQSRLRVKLDNEARRIWLMRGRAMFHVARNPSRPFFVQAQDTTVRAVGTAFGVERRDHNLVVITVAEGKVAVSSPGLQPPTPTIGEVLRVRDVAHGASGAQTGGELLLSANQQTTVRGAGAATPAHLVDSKQELAWAEGRLIFKDDEVAKVVAEFNRYNRVQLRVPDVALAARRVSGVFDAAYPEEFIAFLQGTMPVEIERVEGRTITISPVTSPRSRK